MRELTLTKKQKFNTEWKVYKEQGATYRVKATVRYDDNCGNGHNSFSITADGQEKLRNGHWRDSFGGCCHDEIAKHFPELKPFIKWHLFNSTGPMHYIANTCYHASNRDFDAARSCAIWPEATDEQLSLPRDELEKLLVSRQENLVTEFKADVEKLGLVF